MSKKLYRSRSEKMIAGVAGGVANYFDIDPTLVRIIFLVSLFMGGTGIVAYIILWIAVPEEPYPFQAQYSSAGTATNADPIVGDTATASGDMNDTYKNSKNDTDTVYTEIIDERRNKRNFFLGVVLILAGALFLIGNIFPRIDFADLFPLILLLVGIWLLTRSKKS